MNYFRVTIYDKTNNISAILDSNGAFDKLWQFSAYLVSKGLKILDACKIEDAQNTNIKPVNKVSKYILLILYIQIYLLNIFYIVFLKEYQY